MAEGTTAPEELQPPADPTGAPDASSDGTSASVDAHATPAGFDANATSNGLDAKAIALRRASSLHRAFDESLVLRAEDIPHSVHAEGAGWALSVDAKDAPRASASIDAWEEENRPSVEVQKRRWSGQTPAPIFAAICLAGQLATGPRDDSSLWFQRGTADASAILHGQIWRCATALTLHADLEHALGNLLCGYIIVDALGRRLGPAWAAWLTLLAGIAGNYLTALAVRQNHFSIGASTSVFGALGALVAAQLISRDRSAFLTLGAGVALLAFLGTSARSDLFAHLFGALSGFVFGLVAGIFQREAPKKSLWQPLFATAALIPLAFAWFLALR